MTPWVQQDLGGPEGQVLLDLQHLLCLLSRLCFHGDLSRLSGLVSLWGLGHLELPVREERGGGGGGVEGRTGMEELSKT